VGNTKIQNNFQEKSLESGILMILGGTFFKKAGLSR
jgi:hypothetical protein